MLACLISPAPCLSFRRGVSLRIVSPSRARWAGGREVLGGAVGCPPGAAGEGDAWGQEDGVSPAGRFLVIAHLRNKLHHCYEHNDRRHTGYRYCGSGSRAGCPVIVGLQVQFPAPPHWTEVAPVCPSCKLLGTVLPNKSIKKYAVRFFSSACSFNDDKTQIIKTIFSN